MELVNESKATATNPAEMERVDEDAKPANWQGIRYARLIEVDTDDFADFLATQARKPSGATTTLMIDDLAQPYHPHRRAAKGWLKGDDGPVEEGSFLLADFGSDGPMAIKLTTQRSFEGV